MTMSARSQGKLYTQREIARDDGLHCDLQAMYVPLVRHSPARTHIVLNNTPPLPWTETA